MTDKFPMPDVLQAVQDAITDIKDSYYGYGQVIITVSGSEVKHVNVTIPYRGRPKQQ